MELPFIAPRAPAVRDAIAHLSMAVEAERGEVYTRPEVVTTILDLAGYTTDRPLHTLRLLEPAFGLGDFLCPAVDRLLKSARREGLGPDRLMGLADAVRGVEVYRPAYERTQTRLIEQLVAWGARTEDAASLVRRWLIQDDFLLSPFNGQFDLVLGNPPYVRQERIAESLLAEYRGRFTTIFDRADLYIPFFERGLRLLAPGGRLAYICSNRWLKNRYGGPLRAFVSSGFHLRYYIDMEGTSAFLSDVTAYPAITVFERGGGAVTRAARQPEVSGASLARLTSAMIGAGPSADARVEELPRAATGEAPWLLDSSVSLRLLRDLEDGFPTLEEVGCKVGIGVATGADRLFIGPYDALDVEDAHKLPLVMAPDLEGDRLEWRGQGVINPFGADGRLVSLEGSPRFAAWARANKEALSARHCAKRSPTGWYRTIDRITPALQTTPKLLIPDIKGEPTVVYDPGLYYPHHNLYFVLSESWELPALGVVLRSSVAALFIASYSVRMAGGFFRFQAQNLRRVRLPRWESLSEQQRQALREASHGAALAQIDAAVAGAFGLSDAQVVALRAFVSTQRPRRIPRATATSAA
jgi:hypothetical protein